MRVAVIIPARNEAAAIGQVLAEIPRHLVHDILVVDNGSTDGTAAAASRAGAGVVRMLKRGYGRACLAGLAAIDRSASRSTRFGLESKSGGLRNPTARFAGTERTRRGVSASIICRRKEATACGSTANLTATGSKDVCTKPYSVKYLRS